MPVFVAFFLLVSWSVVYAFAKGGPAERAAVSVTLVAAIASPLVAHDRVQLWHGSEDGIFLVDLTALAAYVVIMVRSCRFWPIWTTAFQFLTVAAHLGPIFRHMHVSIPFAFAEEIWGWVIFAQLILVTWLGSHDDAPPARS